MFACLFFCLVGLLVVQLVETMAVQKVEHLVAKTAALMVGSTAVLKVEKKAGQKAPMSAAQLVDMKVEMKVEKLVVDLVESWAVLLVGLWGKLRIGRHKSSILQMSNSHNCKLYKLWSLPLSSDSSQPHKCKKWIRCSTQCCWDTNTSALSWRECSSLHLQEEIDTKIERNGVRVGCDAKISMKNIKQKKNWSGFLVT